MVAGGDAGGGKGWITRNSFFPLSFSWGGEGGYTHILQGGRRSVHCFRYCPFHSAPNTRPLVLSFCSHLHWIVTMHTRSITPFTRSHSLFHPCTFFLSFFLTHFLVCLTLFQYFFLSFFFLLIIYTRARSCLSCSHIQQHLNIVFSVIIKRNNDNI